MSQVTLGQVAAHPPDPAALPTHGVDMGTPIQTLDGILPVEYLAPGDRIVTRNGARRLAAIEVTLLQNARIVRLGANSLGHNRPSAALIVIAGQPVLLCCGHAHTRSGSNLIPAARLASGPFIRPETLPNLRLYTLIFAHAEVIHANGVALACPSLISPAP